MRWKIEHLVTDFKKEKSIWNQREKTSMCWCSPNVWTNLHITLSNLSLLHFPVSPLSPCPHVPFLPPLPLTPSSSSSFSLPLVCRPGWQDERSGIAAYILPLSPQNLTLHTLYFPGCTSLICWFQACFRLSQFNSIKENNLSLGGNFKAHVSSMIAQHFYRTLEI